MKIIAAFRRKFKKIRPKPDFTAAKNSRIPLHIYVNCAKKTGKMTRGGPIGPPRETDKKTERPKDSEGRKV